MPQAHRTVSQKPAARDRGQSMRKDDQGIDRRTTRDPWENRVNFHSGVKNGKPHI